MHRDDQVARAEKQLRVMIKDLLTDAQASGDVRNDVTSDELASYCLHALTAAGSLRSKAAVRRLVDITLAGLRPARPRPSESESPTRAGRPTPSGSPRVGDT
jgi:hypothetical protein